MKQEVTYRNIWRVAFPIILSSTAQNLVNAIDTAFLGRISDVTVGAAGNAILFYYIFVVTATGFSIGAEVTVGRKNGEGNFSSVGKIIDHCIYTFIPLSICLFLLLQFFAPFVLKEVTQSEEIAILSGKFLFYRSFGIFFALSNLVFHIFYVGTTQTRILTTSTFFMAMVNVVLDYTLIFGNFGFPAMGIEGAAIASVIAEASTTVYFIIHTKRQEKVKKFELFRFTAFRIEEFKKLMKISAPTMLQNFLALSSWLIFFLIIEKLGERELAISHIVRSIYMVLIIPMFGFSIATNALVSNVIGQGDIGKVLNLIKKTVILCLACTSVFLPLVFGIPTQLISIYTNDPLLISEAVPVLYVVGTAMMFFAIAYTTFSGVSGTGKTLVSLFIEIVTLVIYLSSAYILGIHLFMPLHVVWYSEFIYFGVMGSLSYLYLKFGNWKNVSI